MRKNFIRFLSISVTITFLSQNIVWSEPVIASTYQPISLSTRIYIPEEYGKVKNPVDSQGFPMVILIKDAHCVYEAQKNIERILDILIRDYRIDLVCVEGASGNVDTSILGAYPDKNRREMVTDKYVRKGLFTASEALGIKRGVRPGFTIYGVEDAMLYWKDFKAFRDTIGGLGYAERFIDLMGGIVGRSKEKIYTDELKEFDRKVWEYRGNELSLTEWIRYIRNQKPVRPAMAGAPNQKNFNLVLKAIDLEEGIDFKEVENERAALIKEMEKSLPKEDLREFVEKSLLFKLGKVPALDYYTYLGKYLSGGENLQMYTELVRLQAEIDENCLFQELEEAEESIYKELIQNEIQRNLYQLDKDTYILNRIMHLQATRDDILYYMENKEEFDPEGLLQFIKIQAQLNNVDFPPELNDSGFLNMVRQVLKPTEEFYSLAMERDRALAGNLISQMEAEGRQKAVLVAGGFHSEGIERFLEEKGISCITIVPAITRVQDDSHELYLKRMLDSRIEPDRIIEEMGHGNIQAPVACTRSDLLKGPAEELAGMPLEKALSRFKEQYKCKDVDSSWLLELYGIAGFEKEVVTIGDILEKEGELKEEYITTDNEVYAQFLYWLFDKAGIDITGLLYQRELEGLWNRKDYSGLREKALDFMRSSPDIGREYLKRLDEVWKEIGRLTTEAEEYIKSGEYNKALEDFDAILKEDTNMFFQQTKWINRAKEQIEEFAAAGRLEAEEIPQLIKEQKYIGVYSILKDCLEKGEKINFSSPEVFQKVMALIRVLYKKPNIGSLIDMDWEIFKKIQFMYREEIAQNSLEIIKYCYEFNKHYEKKYREAGLAPDGRDIMEKDSGILEKWHSLGSLQDKIELVKPICAGIAGKKAEDVELVFLRNILSIIAVYFKDRYNMDIYPYFGDPQECLPEDPDYRRLIEETQDNYRKLIKCLADLDSVIYALGEGQLNLDMVKIVKEDGKMSINLPGMKMNLCLEFDGKELNFYRFSRFLLHELGHLCLNNIRRAFIMIDKKGLNTFMENWGGLFSEDQREQINNEIKDSDELNVGSIAYKIVEHLYAREQKDWIEIAEKWEKEFPEEYREYISISKKKMKALCDERMDYYKKEKEFNFILNWISDDPAIPSLDIFHMYETMRELIWDYAQFGIGTEFKKIPFRKNPREFFAEYFQLYVLYPEVLRKMDGAIYDLMNLIIGDRHLNPGAEGFNMVQAGGAIGKWEIKNIHEIRDNYIVVDLAGIEINKGKEMKRKKLRIKRIDDSQKKKISSKACSYLHGLPLSEQRRDIRLILGHIIDNLDNIFLLQDNPYIQGYGCKCDGKYFISVNERILEAFLEENKIAGFIALFHEAGHSLGFSHTYLRGLGKGIRNRKRGILTDKEKGLQDILFGISENDELTEMIRNISYIYKSSARRKWILTWGSLGFIGIVFLSVFATIGFLLFTEGIQIEGIARSIVTLSLIGTLAVAGAVALVIIAGAFLMTFHFRRSNRDTGLGPKKRRMEEGILEQVAEDIKQILNKRGIRVSSRIIIEAIKGKDRVSLEEIITEPSGLFELAYEISVPLRKIIPHKKEEEGGEIVARVLKGILKEMEKSGIKLEEGEDDRENFFNTVEEILIKVFGVTEAEIASDIELINMAFLFIEAGIDSGCLDLIGQIMEMTGVSRDKLLQVLSDEYFHMQIEKLGIKGEKYLRRKGLWDKYRRIEETKELIRNGFEGAEKADLADSPLERAAGRLRLYKKIKAELYKKIKDEKMDGKVSIDLDIDDTVGLTDFTDFKDVVVETPQELNTYLSGTAAAYEGSNYLIRELGIRPEEKVKVSISEGLFFEELIEDSITYSPGFAAVLKQIPGLTVEIRAGDEETKEKLNRIKDLIINDHPELKGRIEVTAEFKTKDDLISIPEEERQYTVYVLGDGQEDIGRAMESEIKNNQVKVFCTSSMALHAVLLYGLLQASVKEIFENGRYTEDGKSLVQKLQIFGVSKEDIDRIIAEGQAFFIITTDLILRQYQLYRVTIAISA